MEVVEKFGGVENNEEVVDSYLHDRDVNDLYLTQYAPVLLCWFLSGFYPVFTRYFNNHVM